MAASIVKSAVHKLCWQWQALVLIALHLCYCHNFGAIAQEVPCCFIFGDSLVDNGNNNHILSLARADYPPYGIDFPAGPSGRFSNGKTTADVISTTTIYSVSSAAELLGFDDYIPPYSAATGKDVLKGVNYASAAAGIRDDTGRHLGERISFSGQVRNHQETVSRIAELMGSEEAAAKHLSKCIYSFGLGSNDYLNNYFVPLVYTTALEFTPEEYADDLIRTYTGHLQIMYKYGARKFVLIGVGPVGCSPSELTYHSLDGRTCVQRINSANQIFNDKLRSLVARLNRNVSDANFVFINAYGIVQDLIDNPGGHGFQVTNEACCGVGRNNGQITCLPLQAPCENRDQYLFWDAFHPKEAANRAVGRRFYKAQSPSDTYPFDIHRLAQL
ncbi:unnamed protein product [Linum tenue]|uniref:Uncharacterized protein n=1 Tax=Linum tenue TaxID=586396 RepID=A0AAV0PYG3_9ROSI|nr:unnamed protein product [Linum tenue]